MDEIAEWIKENRRETMEKTARSLLYFDSEQWQKDTQDIYDSLPHKILFKNVLDKIGIDSKNYWRANYHANCRCEPVPIEKPKRKSWIEKIRDYDNVFARMQAAEAMRDHYKTVFSETRNELVKQRSIINENNKILGRRLKFSTHGLKFLIEIGNPFTLCTMHYHGWIKNLYSVAMKNQIDEMDWKKAAVQSVENLCREWVGDRDIQSSIFEALFSAHPELRTK
jgi:hypothetical protein